MFSTYKSKQYTYDDTTNKDVIKDGTTSLYMRFAAAVPAGGVTLIAYAEVDALLMIDRNRAITSDMSI